MVALDSHFFASLCPKNTTTSPSDADDAMPPTFSTILSVLLGGMKGDGGGGDGYVPLVLTPLNSLLYNLDADNLAQHGCLPLSLSLSLPAVC